MGSSVSYTFQILLLVFSVFSYKQVNASRNNGDNFAPCAHQELLAGVVSRGVAVEFTESVCAVEENRRRKEEGVIGPKYFCFQLRKKTTIYRDINNSPIEVVVDKRKAGCELRCIEKSCGEKRK